MFRKAAGAAACGMFIGCIVFGVAAWAQEHHHGAPRSLTFGERLDRFRRNIIGEDEEQAPEMHNHKHSSPAHAPSQRIASSAQRSSASATQGAAASQPPRLTKQSAVKAQGTGNATTNVIRRQTTASAPSRAAAPPRSVDAS